MSDWKVIGVVVEGHPIDVGGLDPWNATWVPTGAPPVQLPHPYYPTQRHAMHIYEIERGGKKVTFAAGELSAPRAGDTPLKRISVSSAVFAGI